MAQVTVRGLPAEVKTRLRVRASQAGRSMEAELRLILEQAVEIRDNRHSLEGLRDWFRKHYKGTRRRSLVDELIAERRREAKRESAKGW